MNSTESFWENKRVFVTGVSGFVGSHLTSCLLEKGARVVGLKHTKANNNRNDYFIEEKGSVKEFGLLRKIIHNYRIEYIFHLAGQPLVETGSESPLETFSVNIQGTWNILEAARLNKVKKIIVASTTHVYGDNPNVPYTEDYYPQPSRPYETSKACADLLAQSYADTYGLPVEIFRFVNLYGPGDTNFSRLIPKVMRAVLENKNIHIWDVGAVRDFLYIKDAVNAYIMLAEKSLQPSKRARIINIGTGNQVRVVSVARKIIKISGRKKIKLIIDSIPKEREKEIKKQYISIEKARKVLSWKPIHTLEEGLTETFAWYKDYFNA